jgi:predicted CXXCH cytochrome family protein
LRHPTDIVLPAAVSKEYYKYNGGVGANNPYSLNAPVGRATIPNAVSAVVNPGTDDSIVTCLSCHKAHASANQDILRWNYEDINAGSGVDENARCFICHTTKDGV